MIFHETRQEESEEIPIPSSTVNDEDVTGEEMETQFPMDLDSEAALRKDLKRISVTPIEVLEKAIEQEVLGEGEHEVVSGESSDSGQYLRDSSGTPLGSFLLLRFFPCHPMFHY